MTGDELLNRVVVEASMRGFSVECESLVYKNRVKTLSKTRLRINGFRCRLHHLENMRIDGDNYYAMFGITRVSLRKSDFAIVSFCLPDGGEGFLIIPSKALLRKLPKGTRFKRFYISLHDVIPTDGVYKKGINWFIYNSRWERLRRPLSQ